MNSTAIDHLCMGCMRYLDKPGTRCPACGWEPGMGNQPHQLEAGAILAGKYLVGRVLGQGGFGITYMGWDIPANAKRAIKEYYPSDSVTRQGDGYTVTPYSSQGVPRLFAEGRDKFYSEAQNLARFDHVPDIVSVKDFFQENGTAYIVMEFIEGQTFKDYLTCLGRPMELGDTLALLAPVARSLELVHGAGLIHRDVSPDNIMLTTDGTAKLLDFGAARGFSLQGARTNTVNVKMGYAPDEQYRTHGNQGPWTDVYALAATIYRAVTGVVPTQAIDRAPTDLLDRPTALGANLTPAQERVLLKGMAVYPDGRYQSIREFYDAMERTLQGGSSIPVDDLLDRLKKFTGGGEKRAASGGRTAKNRSRNPPSGDLSARISSKVAANPQEARRKIALFFALLLAAGMAVMFIGAYQSNAGVYQVYRYLDDPVMALQVPAALSLACVALYVLELLLRFLKKSSRVGVTILKYAGVAHVALCVYIFVSCLPVEDILAVDVVYLIFTGGAMPAAYRLLSMDRV